MDKIKNLFKIEFVCIAALFVLIIAFVIDSAKVDSESTELWNNLKLKSENHKIMVTSYRDCRNSLGSMAECKMFTLKDAEARDINEEIIKAVYLDILNTSDKILKDVM